MRSNEHINMEMDTMMSTYEEKITRLKRQMETYASEDVAVAFSGGVDSSLLLKMACDAVSDSGNRVFGILLHTMLHPSGDVLAAEKVAKETGAEFLVLELDELEAAGIGDNPEDRCYRCKRYLFRELIKRAESLGVSRILEGTNEDDMHGYRPGIRAVKELGIISPLADAALTKAEVRRLAGEYGISVSDKPSTPCLATRFPYGTRLCREDMRRVEHGEAYLRTLGFYNVRLRVHKDIARIEVDSGDFEIIVKRKEEIVRKLKGLGYAYVTLDLAGFRSGSMDDSLRTALK